MSPVSTIFMTQNQVKTFDRYLRFHASFLLMVQVLFLKTVVPPLAKVITENQAQLHPSTHLALVLSRYSWLILTFALVNVVLIKKVSFMRRRWVLGLEVTLWMCWLVFDFVAFFFPFLVVTGQYIPD